LVDPFAVAELLDEWGFPLVTGDVPIDLLRLAKAALSLGPVNALRLKGSSRTEPSPHVADMAGNDTLVATTKHAGRTCPDRITV
jgi:hypothetical protein